MNPYTLSDFPAVETRQPERGKTFEFTEDWLEFRDGFTENLKLEIQFSKV